MTNNSQKGFAHLFLIVLLLAGVGIGIYLVKNPTVFNPKAAEVAGQNVCGANSIESLRNCISGLSSGQTDTIEINSLILCNQQSICNFELKNINRPITIRGAADSGAGFQRTQKYDYSFFDIYLSSNITIKNLSFDDLGQVCNSNGPAPSYTWQINPASNPNCAEKSQIAINSSSNIILDGVNLLHAQSASVSVYKVNNFVLRNSKIVDSGRLGVWIPVDESPGCVDCFSRSVHVDNNLFKDISTEAILFGATGTASNLATLNNNMFIHNHQRDIYKTGGGTLNIQRLSYAEIKGNIISKNKVENTKEYISGAGEIASNIDNTVISGNSIHDNSGGGIGLSLQFNGNPFIIPAGFAQNVKIERNKFYNNNNLSLFPRDAFGDWNFPFIGPPAGNIFPANKFIGLPYFDLAKIQRENCESSNCPGYLPVKMGKIYADPASCVLQTNQTQCKTTIKWHAHDGGNVRVKVSSGSSVNQPLTGPNAPADSQADVPWITTIGAKFDLYLDGQIYDSVFVKASTGIPAVPSPSPSPSPRANTAPIGIFDGVYGTQLIGWACDLDVPATAPWVHLYIDDKYVSVYKADKTGAAGIAANCGGYPDRRFVIDIPAQFKNGVAHLAKVYVIDNVSPGINTLTNGSPKSFTLGSTPTPTPTPASTLITASPNPCTISSGSTTCTSAIKLNAGGHSNLQIKVREAGNAPFTGVGASPTGIYNAPWIPASGYTFDLYSNGTVIGSVFVKGIAGTATPTPTPTPVPSPSGMAYKGNIAAVPSSCKLGSNGLCTVTVNWDVSNAFSSGTILIKADGANFTGGGISGSASAPWINVNGVRFDLYVNGQLYDSVVVKGTP